MSFHLSVPHLYKRSGTPLWNLGECVAKQHFVRAPVRNYCSIVAENKLDHNYKLHWIGVNVP